MTPVDLPDVSVVPQHYEEAVDIDSVVPWPDNPRRSHKATMDTSLSANGFYGATLVQTSSRRIIAGHGRIDAARRKRLRQVPMIFLDVDDETAARIVAIDNRSNDLATYDASDLRAFLAQFHDKVSPIGTGYSERAIAQILAETVGTGSLLTITDVAIAEPTHQPKTGDVWKVGRHYLIVEDVMTGWSTWAPFLREDALFVPYPGPYAPLSERAEARTVVLVQPDPYIAGHILDKYKAVKGKDTIMRVGAAP